MKRAFNNILLVVLLTITTFSSITALSQTLSTDTRSDISDMLTRIVAREILGGSAKVDRVRISGDKIDINASIGLSYYPFREDNVAAIYDSVRQLLPEKYASYRLSLITDNHKIEEFVPMYYRTKADKNIRFKNTSEQPLVRKLSSLNNPTEGLYGRHIAMWQSHGRYFEQDENLWRWQRSRLWETVEDLFTQSFVLPYLVPMLENAGANVLLPRERDTQINELLIDNDEGIDNSRYTENNGKQSWKVGGKGFAHKRQTYLTGQNPFHEGTTRVIESITSGDEATAEWCATIPETGRYAVYVAYESFGKESSKEAEYTVHHAGGESRFAVNQSMGGGMWIYLGHFDFKAGKEQTLVTLTNKSAVAGKKISADAVKIGGGYGNIARIPSPHLQQDDIIYEATTSEYPRFCEGARYWLQWSGFEEDVYTPKENKDDYRDDYMSRAHWVNAVMGGSERLPKQKGKSIPLDMALAFHSDAGARLNDDIIGTLGIYYTKENKGRFEGGADRYLSRDLTDVVMTQIVDDIRATMEPNWSRRGMWNRSYYEARVPGVPTMLLESMSHQNFADMRYGNDPHFKFLISRAIYKGVLRYISSQYNTTYTVQPLPVESFSVKFTSSTSSDVLLEWKGVEDDLEVTADADYYIVYTRIDDGSFDNGKKVIDTSITMPQQAGHTYSYYVTAVNKGGESFPSEILSAHRTPNTKGCALVINGFDRVGAPLHIQGDSLAGFYNAYDAGVAYKEDISFIGEQRVFDRRLSRSENDNIALGSSYSDYETEVIAGNSFDYTTIHGEAIVEAGYSYCSSSVKAVEQGRVALSGYDMADLILGKQHSATIGRGTSGIKHKAFTIQLQEALQNYTNLGGALFVSGCYVASDLWNGPEADYQDKAFAREVLHISYNGDMATRRGVALIVASPMQMARADIEFNMEPSRKIYSVESPGCIVPYGREAFIAMRYPTNNQVAAVGYKGKDYRTLTMGFPFETIKSKKQRNVLMRGVIDFLCKDKSTEEN